MLSLIVALLTSSAISAVLHVYVWLRLVRAARLPRRWHRAATAAMVVLYVAVPVTISSRTWAPDATPVLAWVFLPWMAFLGLTFVALVAIDVARVAAGLARRARRAARRPAGAPGTAPAPEVSPERRLFLARIAGGGAAAVARASVAAGAVRARGTHEIVDVEVPLAKLPRALDGFTIVQLSDLHVGLTIDRAFVQRVVDRANALSPDLIALTGDLVDGKVDDLRDDFAPLGGLRARHGVYSVTGNHEYYSGVDPWLAELRRLGVRCLRNERVAIGDGDATFDLIGVDDHGARGGDHGEDFAAATAGRDPARALIALAHQPRQVRRAARHGVDLQLSGHTHGGQIWPWHHIVKIQQGGLLAGHYTYERTQLYVTRGCGYWGPPVRLLAPLEITRVILRKA